jgi:hypothetical protein
MQGRAGVDGIALIALVLMALALLVVVEAWKTLCQLAAPAR